MWKGKICKKARKDAMIKLKFSLSPLYVNTKIRARGHQLSVFNKIERTGFEKLVSVAAEASLC